MITSGLVNQRRGGGFQNGYPHQLPAKSEFIRPYVSIVDKTILTPSSLTDPMQYETIVPSPVIYDDIFGKKATPDERLYVLRQIQQGIAQIEKVGVRPVVQTPTIPPNTPSSGIPPRGPAPTPETPGAPKPGVPTPGVPTEGTPVVPDQRVPGAYPVERAPTAPLNIEIAPSETDSLDQKLLAAEVVEPLTPTETVTQQAQALNQWLHLNDVSRHFNQSYDAVKAGVTYFKDAIGGIQFDRAGDAFVTNNADDAHVPDADDDPYKYAGARYQNEIANPGVHPRHQNAMREANPGVHPRHLNGFHKSRQGVPPE